MKVKNLVPWAGEEFNYVPGDVVELPDAVAKDRIEAGLAQPLDEPAPAPKAKAK
jgi:hypothetical protein